MSTIAGLNRSILVGINERRSECLLIGLNEETDADEEVFVFQYFPETVTSTKAANYQPQEVPGGSLPITQWISSGEHTVSFTAIFSADIDFGRSGNGSVARRSYDLLRGTEAERATQDIRTALMYLRSFMYPRYGIDQSGQGRARTFAPRKCKIVLPNSGIGTIGGILETEQNVDADCLICIMNTCDITYDAFFPSGIPRLATVSLSFAQVPQYKGRVRFPQSATTLVEDADGVASSFGETVLGGIAASAAVNYKTQQRQQGMLSSGPSKIRSRSQIQFQPYTVQQRGSGE
jgi:hypothetical protein